MEKKVPFKSLKRLVTRNVWAGPVIGFVFAAILGPGIIWSFNDYRLKNRSAVIDQARFESELTEKLQSLQAQISSSTPQYVELRNRYFSNREKGPPNPLPEIDLTYQLQTEYRATKERLLSLIAAYNRLEVNLSLIQQRDPIFFKLSMPTIGPKNLKLARIEDGRLQLQWSQPLKDELEADVAKDLEVILKQYGRRSSARN